jgi:hypothetical protein
MTAITATDIRGPGWKALTPITLAGSDTLTYNSAKNPVLVLFNPTASPITPTIIGDEASAAVDVPGYGTVDASAGLSAGSIAADAHKCIALRDIFQYLTGAVTIENGTGLHAFLLER